MLPWVVIFGLAYCMMLFAPTPGVDFHASERPFIDYPPWINLIVLPVRSLTVANALTLTVLAFALWRSKAKPIHYFLAFLSLPLYWNLWLGQYEFIPLLGMACLPWGLALALTKPQVALWGVAAWWSGQRGKWKIAAAVIGGAISSLIIYGWWPTRLLPPTTLHTFYNLSTWYWGGDVVGLAAVAIALFAAFKTQDIDQSMALGALATPYIQGHSYLLLVPAFARLSGLPLLLVWLASWLGVATLLWGDGSRILMLLFPISMWAALFWTGKHSLEKQGKTNA